MMQVLPCVEVRDELQAYHDGELDIERQVLIQSHVHDCVACRLEAASLAELSDVFRTMAHHAPDRTHPAFAGAVLERVRLERQLSLMSQARGWFDDMHLVWAGLGATMAMLFCVFASASVLHAANQERPDSLAGIISTIASGAHDPWRLAGAAGENHDFLDSTEDLDADVMLSAFVTRDGRIQNVELLEDGPRVMTVQPDAVMAIIEAASRARFTPAQMTALPGGMNVVWFVTSTTVRGAPNYDLYLLSPPRVSSPAGARPSVRRHQTPVTRGASPSDDDGLPA